jgi:uncharacterized protein
MSKINLEEKNLLILTHILIKYIDIIDEVIIFGSRANGSNKKNSDLDLAIKSDDKSLFTNLMIDFSDSDFPYFTDIIRYSEANELLKTEIDKYGVKFKLKK